MDKLSLSVWTSYLSYDVCFVSKDMCWLCLYVEMGAMRDRADLSMKTGDASPMTDHILTDYLLQHLCLSSKCALHRTNLLHKNKNIHLSYRPNIILQYWRFANILQIILQFMLQTGITHHHFFFCLHGCFLGRELVVSLFKQIVLLSSIHDIFPTPTTVQDVF